MSIETILLTPEKYQKANTEIVNIGTAQRRDGAWRWYLVDHDNELIGFGEGTYPSRELAEAAALSWVMWNRGGGSG
jgi:hypothetical protein